MTRSGFVFTLTETFAMSEFVMSFVRVIARSLLVVLVGVAQASAASLPAVPAIAVTVGRR